MIVQLKFTLDRVTGYHRPIEVWNDGKRAEFKQRKNFSLKGLEDSPNRKPKFHVDFDNGKPNIQEL